MGNKLIVGLGNPGKKYTDTRHNVGFMVVDKLAEMINGQWLMNKKFQSLIINHKSSIIFSKPQTFMNSSGIAVKKLMVRFKIKLPDLWIIHDDLDIRLGSYKIQKGVGPKLHNGIESIERELGTKVFWRVRVGVDNREKIQNPKSQTQKISGEQYVLQDFTGEEFKILNSTIENIVKDILSKLAVFGK